MDLDVESPLDVADVLREAADQYRESAAELEAAWQERSPTWERIATLLDSCAERVEKVVTADLGSR